MIRDWQNKFVVPVLHYELKYRGNFLNDTWWNGELVTEDSIFRFPVRCGIPIFTSLPFNENSIKLLEKFDSRGFFANQLKWIEINWKDAYQIIIKKENSLYVQMAKEVAKRNKLILDIASGLGGGFTPSILYFNKEAKILMNDIEPTVVGAWRIFLHEKNIKNTSFAAFDATRIPIKTNSVDIVVSSGGFGNIPMNYIAFHEVYRILRPGGYLYIADGITHLENFRNLPSVIEIINDISFALNKTGYRDFLEKLGFEIELFEIIGESTLSPDEGEFPKLAWKYGVRIKYSGVYIIARKL